MTKKYQLSITAGYCIDWTVENAVRELFQNQLDSDAEGCHEYDGDTLTITSKGISIPTKTLLLGVSTKRDDLDSVGGKGEGFKLACGILLREGLDIVIYNGSVKWTPVFEYHPDFDEEVLFFYEEPLQGNSDLSFIISGLDEDTYNNIKDDNLYSRDDVTDVLYGDMGAVIKDFGGQIFVGGLYVCSDHRLKYSYDFKPQYLKLNRDRKSVDDWDLRMQTSKLLGNIFSPTEIAEHLRDNVFDVGSGQYHYDNDIQKECFKLFTEENEGCIIADYESEKDDLKKQYSANPVIIPSGAFKEIVKQSPHYRTHLREHEREEYEEDTRTPMDVLGILKEIDLTTNQGRELFNQVFDIFEKRGVYWDDETIDIPF